MGRKAVAAVGGGGDLVGVDARAMSFGDVGDGVAGGGIDDAQVAVALVDDQQRLGRERRRLQG